MKSNHIISKTSALFISFFIIIMSCKYDKVPEITPGVSVQLAQYRKDMIDSLLYDISLDIPESKDENIKGSVSVSVFLNKKPKKIVFDFTAPQDNLLEVKMGNNLIDYNFTDEHIVISGNHFKKGLNQVEFRFIATNQALNRQSGFMYTLFVPDRASTTFPCFDQPDLKARFQLTLETPDNWNSVANGAKTGEQNSKGRKIIKFSGTRPISTYLFSFATGIFDTLSTEKNGFKITMYHRETDSNKLSINKDEIFNQHFEAIEWLEGYTGIPYPFEKFDIVIVPFFQYGGMEHPGAILYRASRLFLDENATQNEFLARANLIAHETAHMWFGDLVTMKWFNDVWMKEVFANFLADKIVNPRFPEINHRLRFLYAHFPLAYETDRSQGANPIRQELENMKNAGTLYGNIIYHKAPIMMNQLEKILGEKKLKKGLRQYLSDYAYGNADWPELVSILDGLSEKDLKKWSKVWVDEPGMAHIELKPEVENSMIHISQNDPGKKGRIWEQILEPVIFKNSGIFTQTASFDKKDIQLNYQLDDFYLLLPDGSGEGYGYFKTDEKSLEFLQHNLALLKNPLHRGIAILMLWEEMLNGILSPDILFNVYLNALKNENDPLNSERMLTNLKTIYWKFMYSDERMEKSEMLEILLWTKLNKIGDPRLKASYFRTFSSVATTKKSIGILKNLWAGKIAIPGLELSENDFINLSFEIAIKDPESAEEIMEKQLQRITNPDRKENFRFVMPALSKDIEIRDEFFESVKKPVNRKVEPGVIQALEYLHHPLRSEYSIKYIKTSLEMLEEIQITGDIFFPKNWLDATLGGHQSMEAKVIVEDFLRNNPNYPMNLKGKILQSADLLFRTVEINKKSGQNLTSPDLYLYLITMYSIQIKKVFCNSETPFQ